MPHITGRPTASSPFKIIFISLLLVVVTGCQENASTEADSVVINANVLTLDSENSIASAMAVKNGNIVYVGDDTSGGEGQVLPFALNAQNKT